MAEEQNDTPEEVAVAPKTETRIDELSASIFESLGYKGKLPDSVIVLFRRFKKYKDILQPGTLSAEGFAFVAVLADLSDGKIEMVLHEEDNKTPLPEASQE